MKKGKLSFKSSASSASSEKSSAKKLLAFYHGDINSLKLEKFQLMRNWPRSGDAMSNAKLKKCPMKVCSEIMDAKFHFSILNHHVQVGVVPMRLKIFRDL